MSDGNSPSQFHDVKRILVIKLKHIGDVLLATPCIRSLHQAFPKAQISALVNENTVDMLKHHPLLKEVIAFPRSALKSKKLGRPIAELQFARKLRKRKFDMVLDLTSGDRPAIYGYTTGARYRLAYDPQGSGFLGKRFLYTHLAPRPTDHDLHESKKNLGILEHFGIISSTLPLELHTTEADRSAVDRALKRIEVGNEKFVIVHPTSRWLFKCWEDSRFAALIDWLQTEKKFKVIFTSGPDSHELERAKKILDLCKVKPHQLLGKLSLTEWAALVAKATLFVGVDSAPMHIAASQNTPCVTLFGPTGFQNWRPWAVKHAVLVHDCPCSRDRKPHCDWTVTRACMTNITLEEVQDAVTKILS